VQEGDDGAVGVALSMAGCRHSLLSLQDGARNLYRVVNGQVASEAAASCYAEDDFCSSQPPWSPTGICAQQSLSQQRRYSVRCRLRNVFPPEFPWSGFICCATPEVWW